MKISNTKFLLLLAASILLQACQQKEQAVPIKEVNYTHASNEAIKGFKKLSEYQKFEGPLADMTPKAGLIPYDLNASLFTDYAHKKRFLFLPEGTAMSYQEEQAFDFPEGSMIFKFFYYPKDFRQADSNWQHIETRVLLRENQQWTALTYVWDETQSDALLQIAGDTRQVSWIDERGVKQSVQYSVPNLVQCKSCHDYNGELVPIGPAARHLNKPYAFSNTSVNQLDYLIALQKLAGIKSAASCPKIPTMPMLPPAWIKEPGLILISIAPIVIAKKGLPKTARSTCWLPSCSPSLTAC
jgi:uncharacterized repeat protein (TIGR03806 family)